MAAPLAVITGPDGRATIDYLAARDQLVAVRVAAAPIGTQDFLLVERPGEGLRGTGHRDQTQEDQPARRPDRGRSRPSRRRPGWSRSGRGAEGAGSGRFLSTARRPAPDVGRWTLPDPRQPPGGLDVSRRRPGRGQEPMVSDWIAIGEAPGPSIRCGCGRCGPSAAGSSTGGGSRSRMSRSSSRPMVPSRGRTRTAPTAGSSSTAFDKARSSCSPRRRISIPRAVSRGEHEPKMS